MAKTAGMSPLNVGEDLLYRTTRFRVDPVGLSPIFQTLFHEVVVLTNSVASFSLLFSASADWTLYMLHVSEHQ